MSVDALQEFRIQTSTYAPEFGRTPGAQISIVTRSGTNQFHGSLFEYFRNDALDAADYFVKRQGLPKPKERQHDFGGVFGGPIDRDRMFVFVSYEGLRLDQPRSRGRPRCRRSRRRLAAPDADEADPRRLPAPERPGHGERSGAVFSQLRRPVDARRHERPRRPDVRAVAHGIRALQPRALRRLEPPGELRHRQRQHARLRAEPPADAHGRRDLDRSRPTLSNELRVNWSRNVGTNFQKLDAFGGAVVPPQTMLHPAFAPPESIYRVNLGAANVFFDEGPNAVEHATADQYRRRPAADEGRAIR